MQIDLHFYSVLFLSLSAGIDFSLSKKIAFSSAYVDHSIEGRKKIIVDKEGREVAEFEPVRTAHNGFESLGLDVQEKIYYPFHFVPSLNDRRFPEILITDGIERSQFFEFFKGLLKENSCPFLLGIVLHPVMDSYSHSGFSGLWSWQNAVEDIDFIPMNKNYFRNFAEKLSFIFKKRILKIAPSVGHAQAGKLPDIPFLLWRYKRKTEEESFFVKMNYTVFLDALLFVYKKFIMPFSKKMGFKEKLNTDEVELHISQVLSNPVSLRKRIKLWIKLISKHFNPAIKNLIYNPYKEFFNTINYKRFLNYQRIKIKTSFEQFESSDFFQFHSQALEYRKAFFRWFKERSFKDSLPVQLLTFSDVIKKKTIKMI